MLSLALAGRVPFPGYTPRCHERASPGVARHRRALSLRLGAQPCAPPLYSCSYMRRVGTRTCCGAAQEHSLQLRTVRIGLPPGPVLPSLRPCPARPPPSHRMLLTPCATGAHTSSRSSSRATSSSLPVPTCLAFWPSQISSNRSRPTCSTPTSGGRCQFRRSLTCWSASMSCALLWRRARGAPCSRAEGSTSCSTPSAAASCGTWTRTPRCMSRCATRSAFSSTSRRKIGRRRMAAPCVSTRAARTHLPGRSCLSAGPS